MIQRIKIAYVIASHGRLNIVKQNIAHLLKTGDVFITVSEQSDYNFIYQSFCNEANELFPSLHLDIFPNEPLGKKWQNTVDNARFYEPDYLVTCGSDDILSRDYIERAISMVNKGYDFIGVNGWYMSDGKRHFHAQYRHLQNFPAGSGRVYTHGCLNKIGWDLFDTKKNRLLDDKALEQLEKHNIKSYISQDSERDGLRVLALKGSWDMLNPMNKFLKAPTIRLRSLKNLPEQFPTITI